MKNRQNRQASGFTLIEVVTTIAITAVVVLAVVSGIVFSVKAQKMAREHSLAQRQAAEILEQARRQSFRELDNQIDSPELDQDNDLRTRTILIDDRQTADDADDLTGVARLHLYRVENGNKLVEVDDALVPPEGGLAETIEDYLLLKAVVSWTSLEDEREVSLITHIATQ